MPPMPPPLAGVVSYRKVAAKVFLPRPSDPPTPAKAPASNRCTNGTGPAVSWFGTV